MRNRLYKQVAAVVADDVRIAPAHADPGGLLVVIDGGKGVTGSGRHFERQFRKQSLVIPIEGAGRVKKQCQRREGP